VTQQANVVSPVILRNAGVPVDVHAIEQDATGTWVRRTNAADEFIYERKHVKFDNRVLMDLESPEPLGWGSQETWEDALDNQPILTLARTLALVFDMRMPAPGTVTGAPDRYAGSTMMLDGQHDEYINAVNAAFMLASGIEPEVVGESLRAARKEARDARKKINEGLSKAAAEAMKEPTEGTPPSEPAQSEPVQPQQPLLVDEPTLISPDLVGSASVSGSLPGFESATPSPSSSI
jgi:hypothetical protein